MNVFKKVMTSAAAMSLAVVPVAAHAADASKLSVASSARVAKSTKAGDELAGGGGFVVAGLAAIAVIVGIIIVADNDDDADSN